MKTKKFWYSKTLWVNTLAGLALIIQATTGTNWLDTELQAAIIIVANTILRIITKTGIEV